MSGNDVIVVVSNGTLHSGTCIKWWACIKMSPSHSPVGDCTRHSANGYKQYGGGGGVGGRVS